MTYDLWNAIHTRCECEVICNNKGIAISQDLNSEGSIKTQVL